jgi:hypothetical protein
MSCCQQMSTPPAERAREEPAPPPNRRRTSSHPCAIASVDASTTAAVAPRSRMPASSFCTGGRRGGGRQVCGHDPRMLLGAPSTAKPPGGAFCGAGKIKGPAACRGSALIKPCGAHLHPQAVHVLCVVDCVLALQQ